MSGEDFSGGSVIEFFAARDRLTACAARKNQSYKTYDRPALRLPAAGPLVGPAVALAATVDILKKIGLARVSYPTHAWVCGIHTGLPCDCGEPYAQHEGAPRA